jgi:hemerythrin-like domain-containing protein
MTTKTSKILSDEHKNIMKVIETLEQRCQDVVAGKEPDWRFFSSAVDFIKNYADKFHHAKEEDILFKEFCKSPEVHCNPVEQMLHEHNQGREYVRGIEQGIREKNKQMLVKNSRGYAQLLREHIFKEDNILYPMADEALGEEIQKGMLKRFEEVERTKKEDKQKYLAFVKSLK